MIKYNCKEYGSFKAYTWFLDQGFTSNHALNMAWHVDNA